MTRKALQTAFRVQVGCDCFSWQVILPWHSEDKTLSERIARSPVLPAGGMGVARSSCPRRGSVVGTGEGLPCPAPHPGNRPLSLSNYKSAKPVFKGDRYHSLAFRDFVADRMNASVRVRGVDAQGVPFSAAVPCTYRWSPHMRKRNLATIYSWVDYVTEELGYDASEVAFLTLTVRHPRKHTYRAASQCVDDLRRAWSLISRDFRRLDLEYLRVIEPGSLNGFAHYHLVVVGASEAVCERLIGRWCKVADALPVGQSYSFVRDIRQTGAYIAKYL